MAEFTNDSCAESIDREITRINCLTGGHPTAAMVPLSFPTDREVITAAIESLGLVEPPEAKVVQIPDTLHLKEVLVSETYREEVEAREDLEIVSGPAEMAFDESGNLVSV